MMATFVLASTVVLANKFHLGDAQRSCLLIDGLLELRVMSIGVLLLEHDQMNLPLLPVLALLLLFEGPSVHLLCASVAHNLVLLVLLLLLPLFVRVIGD